jgi:signal transduction histidine kinase/CheY-like chemotaxis protein
VTGLRSLRAKLTTAVIATAFVALLANGAALLVLELKSYGDAQIAEARTRAEILARATAAAIAFGDVKDADASLRVLKENPDVLAAALYTPEGALFASYARSGQVVPRRAGDSEFHVERSQVVGFHPVLQGGSRIGTVYLGTENHAYERLLGYLGVLGAALLLALALALLLSFWLQRIFTRPILDVADTARRVIEQSDYTVRTPHRSNDETGLLADAFNRMLEEVERRSSALRAADRRKDEFLATLAHELRNPLAPVTNSVQILKLKAPADADIAWARDVIERQVGHMARLLDDLLDVGRITTNKLRLRKSRVDLRPILETAVETSRPLLESGRHALELRLPPSPVWIDGDAVRLAQVFSNLINNAAKYTDRGGRIEVAVEAGPEVSVCVRDNGIGVARETLPHLFEMFSQAAPALDRSQGGLGIGLFLVKSLVDLHGGSVEAKSEGPGRGSEFIVHLPAASPGEAAGAQRAAAPLDGAKRRVLVADDNRDAVDSLCALLRLSGYEAQVARNGAEALERARSFRPQVALLDIGMPKMSGYEVARRIRAEPWGAGMILVAVTGWGQDDDKRRAADAGFNQHLTKPVDGARLDAMLRQYLDASGERRS